MTRTLLTAIFLALFSQTAWGEDIYYCSETHFVEIDSGTLKNYKTKNFKLNVTVERLKFGGTGFFKHKELPITSWTEKNLWKASGDFYIVSFNEGQLIGAVSAYSKKGVVGILISAECDKFE